MTDYDFLAESTTTRTPPFYPLESHTDNKIARVSSISASQALRASSTQLLSASAPASILHSLPTGLDGLDDAISPPPGLSGIPRGSITEIYGPPGVGKTAFSYVSSSFPRRSEKRS